MVHWSFVFLLIIGVLKFVTTSDSLYDNDLYESVLDSETCQRHLKEMNHLQFFDASGRTPQSITLGGQGSLGNYRQCLSIAQQLPNDTILGKYCMIGVPLMQRGFNPSVLDPRATPALNGTFFELNNMSENDIEGIRLAKMFKTCAQIMIGNMSMPSIKGLGTNVAVCLPRSCTTRQAFEQYTDMLNLKYTELYCRLPDDKVFSTVDYIAVITILILGTLTALSTTYDLYNTFVLEKVPAETSKILTCFSIFTNTRRLLTFTDTPGSITCLDGLRSLSILWVIIGHSFSNTFLGTNINIFTTILWVTNIRSLWIESAVLAVDTFFMMSGLLLVYTTVNKITSVSLVKNIHFFYLHRLLRAFPLLATVVLFQASLLHHSADGPGWPALANGVINCRHWWWSALLHVQNYVNITETCLFHTWYLSVDIQLHVISPLVLFWVLRGRRAAWLGLAGALLASIVLTTTYVFVKNFSALSWYSMMEDPPALLKYCKEYYANTLTRSPPFFVGMVFGYLVHIWRKRPKRIPKWFVAAGWLGTTVLGSGIIYCHRPTIEFGPFWSNFLNSTITGLWALTVGLVIFACALGYGGPINWFLSIKIWKFLARISYSLYLIHYPLQAIIRGQSEMPFMFSERNLIYQFCADLMLSLMAATALCVLVDAPFSTLQKILIRDKSKPVAPPPSNGVSSSNHVLVTQ